MKPILKNRLYVFEEKMAKFLKPLSTLTNPEWQTRTKMKKSLWKKNGKKWEKVEQYINFWRKGQGFWSFPIGLISYPELKGFTYDDRRCLSPSTFGEGKDTLRYYQKDAMEKYLDYKETKGLGLFVMPTGGGKTLTALKTMETIKQRFLVIVHTRLLLNQWVSAIERMFNCSVGVIGDGQFEIKDATVGIVNSLYKRLDDIDPKEFGAIITDECHRTPAKTFSGVVNHFDAYFKMGLSATPYRRDSLTNAIHLFLGKPLVEIEVKTLQGDGFIMRPRVIWTRTPFTFKIEKKNHPGSGVNTNWVKMCKLMVKNVYRNNIINNVIEKANGLTLVLSDYKKHLDILAGKTTKKYAILDGDTPKKEAKEIKKKLKKGEIEVLFSISKLIGEGFDLPSIRNVVMTMPISFSGKLKQIVGRALRVDKGKEECVVYDFVDNVGMLQGLAKKRSSIYRKDLNCLD